MDPPEPKTGNAEATTCLLEGYCYGSWRRHAELKKRVIFDRFSGATSENTMCGG